jgi:hypothetical protein
VPIILNLGQSASSQPHDFGIWYLFHLVIGLCLTSRKPHRAFYIIYLSWFAVGMLPWMILGCFIKEGHWVVQWMTISGILTYGSSLVLILFLLYRMRMPTTAFLFNLESRIIPQWKYAIPYFVIGVILGCFFFLNEIHV